MLLLGGLIGFFFGVVLGATLLPFIGVSLGGLGVVGVILGPVVAFLGPLLGFLSVPAALLVGGLSVLIATAIAYALAAVSLLGATPPSPALPALPLTPLELFTRGFIIGLTSSINFLVWAALSGSPAIATVFLVINFLAAVPGVSPSRFVYQPVLGFASWLLPMSYLVTPLGILLFVLNLPSVLGTLGPAALRFDRLTATIETTGGALVGFLFAVSPVPARGFNLGNFTFLRLPPGAAPATVQSPFTGGGSGLSPHETGHTLSIAAFGGFYGWINAIDENIPPLARGAAAYGELVPESHFGGTGRPFVPVW